ncbi:MAG: TatD family hydrolase [Candidatus Latescibacteria bacterium]|nr:TatD family hydrolase [Candidatus Latescibacterota bacterium]
MLCDTHAHLDFDDFDNDRDAVVERAEKAGISCIINPGCDVKTSVKAIRLSHTYKSIYAAVGIHPNSVADAGPGDILEIAHLASDPRVIAIGETGLDFYRKRSPIDVQIRAFRGHLELAKSLGLPVIIHFRDVEFGGIELVGLRYFEGISGVFHCFGGSVDFARKVVSMGFYVGFDGPLTFKKSDREEVAHAIPLDRCLIETDSPFLTPQKYRGNRNEPVYVHEVALKLAEIKCVDVIEVSETTTRNTCELFGIDSGI